MSVVIKRLWVYLLVVVLWNEASGVSQESSFQEAFGQTAAVLRARFLDSGKQENRFSIRSMTRSELNEAAEIVSVLDLSFEAETESVRGMLRSADEAERFLAYVILAKWDRSDYKKNVFIRLLEDEKTEIRRETARAAALLSPSEIRGLVSHFADKRLEPYALRPVLELLPLLRAYGDEETMNELSALSNIPGIWSGYRDTLLDVQDEIRMKLSLEDPALRKEWEQEVFTYLGVLNSMPNLRSVERSYYVAAKNSVQEGVRFSVPYLRYKLKNGDLLAIALIQAQEEEALYEDLRVYAEEKEGPLGRMCQRSLRALNLK